MPRKKSAPAPRAKQPKQSKQPQANGLQVTAEGTELHFTVDDRRYRVRGWDKNLSTQQLRVNLLAARDQLLHLDTLDLCKAKSRQSFIRAAASELYVEEPVIKKDIGQLLLHLEQRQADAIEAASSVKNVQVELTAGQRRAARQLLQDPKLVERILADYETCGLVGEETNKLACYLACVSRRLPEPLAVLIQSGSAAGKTSLMDATLAFVPAEDYMRYSALTGQSLYYMGRQDLQHKILAVAEEQGVAQASYALKLLQSDGCLRIAAAGKNNGSGRQETESYEVQGPVMMFLTTTSETPDPELANRCLTLRVNESPEQTAAIHARQRAAYTLDGQESHQQREATIQLHQNAQRLLQPLPVVIPWAGRLQFRHDQTRMRREHAKYLSLMAASALLHQYQRPKKTKQANGQTIEYLEASLQDAQLANRLAGEVLGQSLDALLPQTRQLLVLIDDYVVRQAQCERKPRTMVRFTQRQLREQFGWGDFQLRRHLARLVELEYVLAHRTGHGNQRQYELLYDGQGRGGEKFLLGLTDPAQLEQASPSQE